MSKRVPKFKEGQRVWEFDENRRVYRRNAQGHATGGPIFEEHFCPMYVVKVLPRFYIIDHQGDREVGTPWPGKVGLDTAEKRYMDDAGREEMTWLKKHRYPVSDAVNRCGDVAILQQIAAIIGYEVAKENP